MIKQHHVTYIMLVFTLHQYEYDLICYRFCTYFITLYNEGQIVHRRNVLKNQTNKKYILKIRQTNLHDEERTGK